MAYSQPTVSSQQGGPSLQNNWRDDALAVDGDVNTWSRATYGNSGKPWWKVDLETEHVVLYVYVKDRGGSSKQALFYITFHTIENIYGNV